VSLVEELARFGLLTSDIDLVVNSHLHFDHCGNNQLFPQAQIFVQADELAIARTPNYTVTEWFDYAGAPLYPVSGNIEIRPGIKLLSTPGHTPGHQAVLIETGSACQLVAAQAAYTAGEFDRGGDPEEQAHSGLEAQYRRSIARLKTLSATHIYFSHDREAALTEQVAHKNNRND
jgi:glyoxylase-like metal-dependent hydrolase (beta-lactamase superfamily II)